jgi:ketosteroid isomerase-like protein
MRYPYAALPKRALGRRRCVAYAPHIASDESSLGTVLESERLARRYFAVFNDGDRRRALELIHPEVELVLKTTRPGEVVRGCDEVARFVEEIETRFYESVAEVYRALDDTRIVVEGRIRWTDEERVLRDDPMIWALEFRDGLLWRSTPASSRIQAETILEASRSADS